MAIRVRVQAADGAEQWVSMDVASEQEAISRVRAAGGRVLAVESATPVVASVQESRFPVLLFVQELVALLGAGLNLSEALTTLTAKEKKTGARKILDAVVKALREGRNFSDALEQYPQVFPEMLVATVRSAEHSGGLAEALSRYAAYAIQFDDIKKKLQSAAIYPLVLLVVGGAVTLFLLGYVVPKFSVVYEGSRNELPFLSGLLLSFGRHLHAHWMLASVALVAGLSAAVLLLQRPYIRQQLIGLVLRAPFIGEKAAEFRLTRFYRGVGLLLHAGIPLPKAMKMVSRLLSAEQQEKLGIACRQVEEGQRLSVALVGAGLAGVVAESLIQVGERSGRLADMLEQAAKFQDEEFSRWLDVASRLIEPALMALIGIVIGGVVVLLYMPIFELAGSL